MSQSGDSSHISQRLEVSRQYLERLATLASKLENAKEGLVRSSYLGTDLDELPVAVRRLWESLDHDIAALSPRDIALKLIHLEQSLATRMKAIMPLVEKVCEADERGEEIAIHGFREQFEDLARLASTALAIRLLAHRKRYKLPQPHLPFSSDTLRERAQRVKTVERTHKLRVVTQMREMMKATTVMLKNEALNAASRTMLQAVMHDLQTNARHLAAGGSFSTLPIPIEHVEMEGDEHNSETSIDATQPVKVLDQSIAPLPSTSASKAPEASHLRTQPIAIASPSLWRQLWIWLKTPSKVSWRQAGEMTRIKDA
jgi:hypothetical protein